MSEHHDPIARLLEQQRQLDEQHEAAMRRIDRDQRKMMLLLVLAGAWALFGPWLIAWIL